MGYSSYDVSVGYILGTVIFIIIIIISYYASNRKPQSDQPASSEDDDDSAVDMEVGTEEKNLEGYRKLPFSELTKKIEKGGDSICSICLEGYKDKDVVRIVPECEHFFHIKCVDHWLKKNSTCPVCRRTNVVDQNREANSQTTRQFFVRFVPFSS